MLSEQGGEDSALSPRERGAVVLVPKLDGSWEPLYVNAEPANPLCVAVFGRRSRLGGYVWPFELLF